MIGRLVENQEVDGFQEQLDHCQATALTSGKHLHLFVRSFAAKHKGAEDIANFQANIAFRHAVDRIKHGEFVVQQLGLVLRIVAYLDVVPKFELATVVYLRHDALYQRRLTFSILTYEGNFLTALNGEIDVVENLMIAVVFLHFVANDGIISRTRARRELQMQASGVYFVDFYRNYLFQLLDAALHLHRFGGFIAETLDEVLDVGNLLLLIFVSPQLTFATLGTKFHVLVVLHAIVHHFSARDLQCAVRDVVYERAVVTN